GGGARIGIYAAHHQLAYLVNGGSLNTNRALGACTYNTVVEEWDYGGGASTTPITIAVGSGGSQVFSNGQGWAGWNGYIELPPGYGICYSCSPNGPQTTWWTKQGVSSPSVRGKAMAFNTGGST